MKDIMASNHIFIGGAPRSGTSLLVGLLDWHPEVLAFPGELGVINKYWQCPEHKRESYFLERFFHRSQGKQAQFVDADYLEAENRRLTMEFGVKRVFAINTSVFRSTYQEVVSQLDGPLIGRIYKGLGAGMLKSSSQAKERYGRPKWLLFKQPYQTELYAQDIGRLLPDCKFIHIYRSPIAQYVSAKIRHTRRHLGLKTCGSKYGVDFATGNCMQWISSRHLAQDNLQVLGSDRYRIVSYEKLVANPEYEMRCIAEWIGIEFRNSLLTTTLLGVPHGSGSSFGGKSIHVDQSRSNRKDNFYLNTSLSERLFVYYLLNVAGDFLDGYNVPEIVIDRLGSVWRLPFKFEGMISYIRRVFSPFINPMTMKKEEVRNILLNYLPAYFRERES